MDTPVHTMSAASSPSNALGTSMLGPAGPAAPRPSPFLLVQTQEEFHLLRKTFLEPCGFFPFWLSRHLQRFLCAPDNIYCDYLLTHLPLSNYWWPL